MAQNTTGANSAPNSKTAGAPFAVLKKIVVPAVLGVGLLMGGVGIGTTISNAVNNDNKATWLSGTTTPTSSSGKVGDFYFDIDDKMVYQKTSNGWELVVDMDTNTNLKSGITAPSDSEGNNGDHYIDVHSYNLYRKENNVWTLVGNIQGEKGAGFISGAQKPTATEGEIGDTYLDLSTYNLYEKTASGWVVTININPDGTADRPYMINKAEDLLALADDTVYTYYRLSQDIDFNDVDDLYADSYIFAASMLGEIDGNGYTIKMPTRGNSSNYGVIFDSMTGALKNVTLHFDNIVNHEITWGGTGTDMTFENVTTTGSIHTPNTTNYSPLVNFAKTKLSFINCTNNMNITGPIKYGSPFLGGYVSGTKVGTTSNNRSIIGDVQLVFKNCTNNGTVEAENAGLVCGNPTRIPLVDNVTVENLVNNGSIIGTIAAGAFTSWSLPYPELDPLNEKVESALSGTGSVEKLTLAGFSVSHDEETRVITVVNTSDNGQYKYQLSLMLTAGPAEGGSSVIVSTVDIDAIGELDYRFYKHIDKDTLDELETQGTVTKTEITEDNITIKQNSGHDAKLYLVTHTVDQTTNHYYYIEIDDGNYEYGIAGDISFSYVVTVLTNDGSNKVVSQERRFWIPEHNL